MTAAQTSRLSYQTEKCQADIELKNGLHSKLRPYHNMNYGIYKKDQN